MLLCSGLQTVFLLEHRTRIRGDLNLPSDAIASRSFRVVYQIYFQFFSTSRCFFFVAVGILFYYSNYSYYEEDYVVVGCNFRRADQLYYDVDELLAVTWEDCRHYE